MARGVPGFVRIGAALAGCALVAACTPDVGPPANTPTPAPPSAASPTASTTPTETDIERQQRLDFEAAEEAYRKNLAERQRLASEGVAQSTSVLRQTSTGDYLKFVLQELREIEDKGWRVDGAVEVVGVSHSGYQPKRLHLVTCEDGSRISILDRNGKNVTPRNQDPNFVQDLTVVKVGGYWRVSNLRSKPVSSFDGAACAK